MVSWCSGYHTCFTSVTRNWSPVRSWQRPFLFGTFGLDRFEADPTHGFTDYLSKEQSRKRNLTFVGAWDGVSYIMADREGVVGSGHRGRGSVRLRSRQALEENVVVLIDLDHMPYGCGAWPAFWTTGLTNWPSLGEIDIIEGVHRQTQNAYTLHTTPGCNMPSRRYQLGSSKTTNCDVNAHGQWPNEGCSVSSSDRYASWGEAFNSQGGGVFGMRWTRTEGIAMWMWKRGNEPRRNTGKVNVGEWGIPDANFPASPLCPISQHFRSQHLILNIAFCGDWAGQPSIWATSGCQLKALTCERSVSSGHDLEHVWWGVRSIEIYTKDE
ncbi:Glycoside hydrolase, family 16 [Phaffia rhodozyma]|uniref:Glycoside hydrolase, family 16 n=1 Tax=Phaffia rhodozyma TaxID=264483 RepID=A0A0F7SGC5_PHARH|nr:Glycoside hydrolase, family 16 [Phaffia rhodozyma]